MCDVTREFRGKPWLLQETAAGSSRGLVEVGEVATVSPDFLQSLLSLDPLHHGASLLTSTILNKRETWWVRSFGTKNGTTKQGLPQKLGLSLCTVTNAHQLFCLMRIYPLFFLFSFHFCQNQTCCLSCVCCTCDSCEGEGN